MNLGWKMGLSKLYFSEVLENVSLLTGVHEKLYIDIDNHYNCKRARNRLLRMNPVNTIVKLDPCSKSAL